MKNVFPLFVLLLFLGCRNNTVKKPVPATPTVEIPKPEDKKPITTDKYRDIEQDPIDVTPLKLVPQKVTLSKGESFNLYLPEGFKIYPAAEGLHRVRFFAKAPDGRLFVTGMYNLTDNEKGKIYILDDFDESTKKFGKVTIWKENLRNPNSVQFYTDKNGQEWLYLALTDSLMRYKYQTGETSPSNSPEKIADFPGYGLNYKYGGWHLTRTLAFHENKLYVSVGSSCNLCEEKVNEPSRAAIVVMNPDGSDQQIFAKGVRNAVDIGWVEGKFYGTNMASDHMGNSKPNDYFYEFKNEDHFGWPYCYEHEGVVYEEDPKNQSDNKAAGKLVKDHWERKTIDCKDIKKAYQLFEAHGSPLGFEYFGNSTKAKELQNYFLVSLHGSTLANVGTGHHVIRMKKGHQPEPFIDGFLVNKERNGRPCDIFQYDEKSFFLSDDFKGVIYFISKED